MLMERRGLTERAKPSLPGDVAYMIAMWHDLGIVSEKDEGHNYLQRSRALFHREAEKCVVDDRKNRSVLVSGDSCTSGRHFSWSRPQCGMLSAKSTVSVLCGSADQAESFL